MYDEESVAAAVGGVRGAVNLIRARSTDAVLHDEEAWRRLDAGEALGLEDGSIHVKRCGRTTDCAAAVIVYELLVRKSVGKAVVVQVKANFGFAALERWWLS